MVDFQSSLEQKWNKKPQKSASDEKAKEISTSQNHNMVVTLKFKQYNKTDFKSLLEQTVKQKPKEKRTYITKSQQSCHSQVQDDKDTQNT